MLAFLAATIFAAPIVSLPPGALREWDASQFCNATSGKIDLGINSPDTGSAYCVGFLCSAAFFASAENDDCCWSCSLNKVVSFSPIQNA